MHMNGYAHDPHECMCGVGWFSAKIDNKNDQVCEGMWDMAKSTKLFAKGVNPAVLAHSFVLLCLCM